MILARRANWEARRQAIIDTSAPVFARRGYHATGIMELCAANDLGKGALYHYIGSKEELLAAIHDRVMDEVMIGADRVAEAGGSPSQQLAMLGDELLDVIHRYPDHVWVFLHEFPALTGERAEQFRQRRRGYERRVEAVLQAGVDSGEFRDLRAEADRHGVARDAQLHLPLAEGGRTAVGPRCGASRSPTSSCVESSTRPPRQPRSTPHGAEYPPSTTIADPVVQRDVVAGQVGVRTDEVVGRAEPEGMALGRWRRAPPAEDPSWMADRNVPGHTQLTRIPSRAYSTAATLASWITAALVAQ